MNMYETIRFTRRMIPALEVSFLLPVAPGWVPIANGVTATVAADFVNQRYWYSSGSPLGYTVFSAWLAALAGTFSRAGNAMMYDSTGKLTYAPNNLLTSSQDFGSWLTLSAVTVNADAIADPFGAVVADKVVETNANTTHNIAHAAVTTSVSGNLIVSVYAKAAERSFIAVYEGTNGQGKFFDISGGTVLGNLVGAPTSAGIASAGGGWFRCWIVVPTIANATPAVYLSTDGTTFSYVGTTGSGVYLASARCSNVTYETTPRSVDDVETTNAAYYGSRFDYNPATLAARGILLEGGRTNVILQSNAFGTTWTTSNVTSVTQNAAGIDGTTSAWTLTASGAGACTLNQTVAAADGNTLSVIATAGTDSFVYLTQTDAGGSKTSYFNVSTGVLGTQNVTSAGAPTIAQSGGSITLLGNSKYLIAIACAGAAVTAVKIGMSDADNSTTVTAARTTILEQSQLEVGLNASSRILTTTGSVTRAQELLSTGIPQTTVGTAYCNADYADTTTGAIVVWVGNTSATAGALVGNAGASTTIQLWNGAAGQATANTLAVNTTAKFASSWDASPGVSVCLSAGAIGVGVNSLTATGNFAIGEWNSVDGSQPFGHMREVAIWTTIRASNTELQRLTT